MSHTCFVYNKNWKIFPEELTVRERKNVERLLDFLILDEEAR